mmetsp:Transcript_29926/g.66224  ORF Transcript_29926/g.66224 Transcript_29926/m.66224 type:complete len:340 (+) Transcript_29926:205-1224(+)|eukprot:CAMPEP_0202905554 /NCGR_PEP_ID=MMETSP1392-20130828/34832_1 /ASSEMBLY_ACC=CAM_ASM_000868 /TAXON_ID=225041 /ORGANISM="Chlamydomonas chlamydogama, Strain SAG 11-48b" /LENGTH=339 /DNA_ID=CAMNT_0049593693 /DNA_START=110 /DNA_END=1129 /DNA_ORIENTATION=-
MIAGFRTLTRRLVTKVTRAEVKLTAENSGLSAAQQETGQKALKILGLDEEQGLSKHDLIIFLYAVGLNPTDDVIDSKLRTFKLHESKTFSFGAVCHIWNSMLQDLTDEEEILRRAFQFFDKDGNGEISVTELRTTMHELGDLLTEEEILSFMAVMDVNNDGVIGYQEFLSTLKTQTPDMVGLDQDQPSSSQEMIAAAERRNDHMSININEGLANEQMQQGQPCSESIWRGDPEPCCSRRNHDEDVGSTRRASQHFGGKVLSRRHERRSWNPRSESSLSSLTPPLIQAEVEFESSGTTLHYNHVYEVSELLRSNTDGGMELATQDPDDGTLRVPGSAEGT